MKFPIPDVPRHPDNPPCSKTSWCRAMERALEPIANSHKKGFSTLVVTHLPTGKTRVVGVSYKKAPNDKGIMLNVCPFCAHPILWEKDVEDFELTTAELHEATRHAG